MFTLMNSRIEITNNRQELIAKPLIYATWIPNLPSRQSSEDSSSSSVASRVTSSRPPPPHSLPRQSSKTVLASTMGGNRVSSASSINKTVPALKQTVISFPPDSASVRSCQPQHVLLAQQVAALGYLPRPPSLVYDSKKMAYRHHASRSVDDSLADRMNEARLQPSPQPPSDRGCSRPQPTHHLDASVSHSSSQGQSSNMLSSLSRPPGRLRHDSSSTTPLDVSVDCLSIRPLYRSQITGSCRQTEPSLSSGAAGFRRDLFPYQDPISKASKAFISRLTEMSILTQKYRQNGEK